MTVVAFSSRLRLHFLACGVMVAAGRGKSKRRGLGSGEVSWVSGSC